MVCETAEDVQACLAFRGLWPAEDKGGDDEEAEPGISLWHRKMRSETEEVLQRGLQRRMARLERKVAVLCGAPSRKATEVQTDAAVRAGRLTAAVERALETAARAAKPPRKVFGPTAHQATLPDPQEEKEDGYVSEMTALGKTMESLKKSLGSRERQIAALKLQLEAVAGFGEKGRAEAATSAECLARLKADPSLVVQAHSDRLARRTGRVAEIAALLRRSREQAKHYQHLAQQQRAFFLQTERVGVSGGAEALARHPAGEVVLVQRPPPMGDEKPEVWDVGTAIANPYVTDSWPFEPNVLASRCPKEAALQPCTEETKADLEEERRRLPGRAALGLRLPLGRDEEEDDDYDDRLPSSTARSL